MYSINVFMFKSLNNLPLTLIKLKCESNELKILNNLPPNLKELTCSDNVKINNIPKNLKNIIKTRH